MTYEDLVKLDRDGKYVELIGGILYNHPAPAPRHQRILGKLFSLIARYIEERGEVFFCTT